MQAYCGIYYRINLVVAVLRGSIGRVIAVLRDRPLLLSLLVERFVLTLIKRRLLDLKSRPSTITGCATEIGASRGQLCRMQS